MSICERCHKGIARQEMEKSGRLEGKLSGDYLKAVSRGQSKLVGKFKMAAGDVISIRGQVMEYPYIPTGIKRELVRFGVYCDWKG